MLAEEVKTIWEKHSTTLVRNGVLLEERLISEVESVVVDDALHQHQDAYLKECMDDQDTLAKMRADMNANQVAGYFHMWNAMYGEVEEAENTSTEITNSVVQNIEPTKASISVKQVILGMILGAVLAVVYIFMAYIMTGKLRTAGEVEKLYGVKMLGAMQNTQQKKKAFAAIDKLVWKLEHGKNAVVDCKEQRKLVAASVYIQCQKYETSKVYASGSKFVNIPADIMNALKEELATMGITLVIGKDITNDADALLEASKAGNVLFVEEKRVSAYKDILKGVQMCANNHIRVLGTVVVE